MLKKTAKPQSNSYICIAMMLTGAKKRRMMAISTVRGLENGEPQKSNVIMFK